MNEARVRQRRERGPDRRQPALGRTRQPCVVCRVAPALGVRAQLVDELALQGGRRRDDADERVVDRRAGLLRRERVAGLRRRVGHRDTADEHDRLVPQPRAPSRLSITDSTLGGSERCTSPYQAATSSNRARGYAYVDCAIARGAGSVRRWKRVTTPKKPGPAPRAAQNRSAWCVGVRRARVTVGGHDVDRLDVLGRPSPSRARSSPGRPAAGSRRGRPSGSARRGRTARAPRGTERARRRP